MLSIYYLSIVELQYQSQVYNIVIQYWYRLQYLKQVPLHLKLLQNIDYIPYAVQYIFISYLFSTSQLVPLSLYSCITPPPYLFQLVYTFVLRICESISVLLYSFVQFLDSTYVVTYSICPLTYSIKHKTLQVHPC